MKMKVSDFVVRFLHRQGVEVVFEMIGGMITHIIDSLYQEGKIKIVSMHHEQSAGFAAEAVGRVSGVPGVALATSGPGATNLVTAIGSCYFDSVPSVFITGQVNTTELSGDKEIRQQGFQETDIVSIVKPITKGAWLVTDAADIERVFKEAFRLALDGRPGPVLIDLPMDIQREEIEVEPMVRIGVGSNKDGEIAGFVEETLNALSVATNPLMIVGGGVRSSGAIQAFRLFADKLGIPIAQTLMGLDTLAYNHPLRIGMLGTYGNRWVNQAYMASDCVLVLGSRLDVRQTGSDVAGFKGARKIFHVDCIAEQINNRVEGCIPCVAHLLDFLEVASAKCETLKMPSQEDWLAHIQELREHSPDTSELGECEGINPNQFMHALSRRSRGAAVMMADVGKNQMWVAQSAELNDEQRMLMSGGMGSMGFGLPAAVGSTIATGKPVLTVLGDGGLQCNIQELEVVAFHHLPVKIVVFNNNSLGMVSQFQDEYFESRVCSTIWGYSAPDFEAVAKAYGISSRTISDPSEVSSALDWLWEKPSEPALLNVSIDVDTKVLPKVAYGRPIDEMDPQKD